MTQPSRVTELRLYIDGTPELHREILASTRSLARLYVRGLFSLSSATVSFRFVVDKAARSFIGADTRVLFTLDDRQQLAEEYARWFLYAAEPGGDLSSLDAVAATMIRDSRS